MSTPLLSTKLFIPTYHKGIVARPKLIQKINAGRESKLILISAPAGYGKTTLLAGWINQLAESVGWISLDAQDNDLWRFFSYFIAGLRNAEIQINENALAGVGHQTEKTTEFLSLLINQVAASLESVYLVLDDYHRITNPDIHQSISYLLDNLPPNMHLIIASRSDPMLRLAKLRAQGELCEIRVDDLRFTIEETGQYFNDVMGLGLTISDISTLLQKTEGWIVGLQLAGISLEKHPDKHSFVHSFAGDNRYIADYLFDEAFNRQPEHIQTFLLQTSILDRFNAALCDAVTSKEDNQTILEELDRANLFLVPLDNQRNWYRYHHLFGELLQNRLRQSLGDKVSKLHAQASSWFRENNLLADSIRHALAADEIEQVVQLTENMAVHKMDAGELAELMTWLDRQPENLLRQFPWLVVARIWANVNTGKFDQAEAEIADITELLSSQSYPEELENRIQGHLAAIRSHLAEMLFTDADAAIKEAEDALALLDNKDISLRSFVAIRWANCLSWKGDFPKAIQALKEAGEACKLAGDGELAINALSEMATLQMFIGQLPQANQNALEIKDYAEMLAQKDGRLLPAMGILYRHLSNIKYERNELDAAKSFAQQAVSICKQVGESEPLCFAFYVLGKAHFGFREYDKFDHYFNQGAMIAEKIFTEGANIALHTRNNYLLLQGMVEETEKSVRKRGLTIQDQFGYQQRLEYQNFARLLAANGEHEEALTVINRVLKVIEEAGAVRFWIRAKIVQAKIFRELNQPDESLVALEAALEPASQGGYIRSFIDEGESVAKLLYQVSQKGLYTDFIQKLLPLFSEENIAAQARFQKAGDMVEPLSERELEVLEHIAQGCSNQEIAQELIVSLYTVKSHARNIFGKLGVKNRTEAVAKARLYGLLPED